MMAGDILEASAEDVRNRVLAAVIEARDHAQDLAGRLQGRTAVPQTPDRRAMVQEAWDNNSTNIKATGRVNKAAAWLRQLESASAKGVVERLRGILAIFQARRELDRARTHRDDIHRDFETHRENLETGKGPGRIGNHVPGSYAREVWTEIGRMEAAARGGDARVEAGVRAEMRLESDRLMDFSRQLDAALPQLDQIDWSSPSARQYALGLVSYAEQVSAWRPGDGPDPTINMSRDVGEAPAWLEADRRRQAEAAKWAAGPPAMETDTGGPKVLVKKLTR